MRTISGVLLPLLLLSLCSLPSILEGQGTGFPITVQQDPAVAKDPILGNLGWREIGPASVGGRIDDFAVLDSNPDTMYVGTASGGAWKTIDGGLTWKPIFEHVGPMSIGAIAVSQSSPSIVWIGTGEANNRQSSSWGAGVYKSMDGGTSWTLMGLPNTRHIGRILIDPRDSRIVYVAALGDLFGPSDERGLYKTTDGGSTWSRVLFVDKDTGVVEVKQDLTNPDTLYASAYERRRTAFGFNGGGPTSALYKSTDAGATWKKLTNGLPYADGGDTGRIGIAVYRRDSRIVYAEVQHAKGGLFRSIDSGETWTKMSDVNPNAPYFSNFYIDPNNDLRIWIAALQGSGQLAGVTLSEDGGKTFVPNRGTQVHPDFHAMWIDPANSGHMIIGVDGGIYVSRDLGLHWEHLNHIPIGQAYQVGFDNAQPYHVCAGYQDNGTAWGPTRTRSINGIQNADWVDVLAGDGFHCQPDLDDSDLVYVESQEGTLLRLKLSSHEWANIVPQAKSGEPPYRWEWNAPIIVSSHQPRRIYFAAQYLFRSDDRGDSWNRISPDLTTNVDRNKLPILGKTPPAPILSKNYGVTWYPTITRISESPVDPDVLWAGTEDGNLQVTRDGGKTWTNTVTNLPAPIRGQYISGVEASRLGKGSAYVVIDGHRDADLAPHVFFTDNFGRTWRSISAGFPANLGVVRVLREDPINTSLLFAGTEFGAFLSHDRGVHWSLLSGKLPSVRIDDIKIQPREHDLILATHGRSLWVLDDISPLESPGNSTSTAGVTLFDSRPAISYRQIEVHAAMDADKPFLGENPLYGALITYRLASKPKVAPVLRIFDSSHTLIQEFTGTADEGLNRVAWDLRYPTLVKATPEQQWAVATGFFYKSVQGPVVLPGDYTVELSLGPGEKPVTRPIHVSDDPAVTLSATDRAARQAAILRGFEMYKTGHEADLRYATLKKTLTVQTASLKESQLPKPAQTALDTFTQRLKDIEPLFMANPDPMSVPLAYVPPPVTDRIARVVFILENYTAAPRPQDTVQLDDLVPVQKEALAKLQHLIDIDLPALNKSLRDANIPFLVAPATRAPDSVSATESEGQGL